MPSQSVQINLPGATRTYTRNNITGVITDVGLQTFPNWHCYRMTRVSNTTPGFMAGYKKRPKAKLYLPMNPFVYTLHKWRGPFATHETRVVTYDNLIKKNIQTDVSTFEELQIRENIDQLQVYGPSGDQISAAIARLDTKVRLDMLDRKVNLVQVYAERHQTVDLFLTTVRRVADSVTELRRGNFIGAGRALGVSVSARQHRKYKVRHAKGPDRAVSSGWLELQYGWKPLLDDIYGSAELIAQHNLREIRSRTVCKVSIEDRGQVITSNDALAKRQYDWSYKYTIKKVIYYSTPGESVKTLAQVGITNPALIAWELTPWSFVVDWFIPIGNWISSWDATIGLVFEKGCQTTFHRYNQKNTGRGGTQVTTFPPGFITRSEDRDSSREYIECRRTTISSFPRIALPRFKNPFSPTHVANALALLNVTFKR